MSTVISFEQANDALTVKAQAEVLAFILKIVRSGGTDASKLEVIEMVLTDDTA